MGEALQSTGRPIVFSLCQYGENDPWKWGAKAGGNLWRTTGDIRDTWESMDKIGFSQINIASFNRPGHWNDPDMLEIGNGGMNADEYRTHMSLWSLLSAPLIAGNDLNTMSDETKSILMNGEVIAIDQDTAANPVQRATKQGQCRSADTPHGRWIDYCGLLQPRQRVGFRNRGVEGCFGTPLARRFATCGSTRPL